MSRAERSIRSHGAAAVLVLCGALLSGCGGGSATTAADGSATVASALTDIPATASQSLAGLLDYQKAVGAAATEAQDRAEPLDVSALTLPTSETAEPSEV